MSNNTHWSADDLKKKGLIMVDGKYVPASSQVARGKVEKLPNLLDKAIGIPPKPNKIRNAVKSEFDGVKFDSNLEKYMHGLLTGAGIAFDFQVEYVLQEKFRYNGEAVRAITLTVDFVLNSRNLIIDTKGYANDIAPVKYKMLKKYLMGAEWVHIKPTIELPSNKKECDLLLNRLLYGNQ